MRINIYDMEQLAEGLWNNYPCYVAYHRYRLTWNILSILLYDTMKLTNKYGYTIASLFNDTEYSNLSYKLFKLVWLFIYDSFVHHLLLLIIPPRKSPRLGE